MVFLEREEEEEEKEGATVSRLAARTIRNAWIMHRIFAYFTS